MNVWLRLYTWHRGNRSPLPGKNRRRGSPRRSQNIFYILWRMMYVNGDCATASAPVVVRENILIFSILKLNNIGRIGSPIFRSNETSLRSRLPYGTIRNGIMKLDARDMIFRDARMCLYVYYIQRSITEKLSGWMKMQRSERMIALFFNLYTNYVIITICILSSSDLRPVYCDYSKIYCRADIILKFIQQVQALNVTHHPIECDRFQSF